MPNEDPFEEHLRTFYKKEREEAREKYPPSEEEWELIKRKRQKEKEAAKPIREEERFSPWSFPRLAFALGTVGALLLAAVIFLKPRGIQMAGLPPEDILRGGELALPETLTLNSKGASITLSGPEGKLEGPLNFTNSSQGLFLFEAILSGANSDGPIRFTGRLVLTNSSPTLSGLARENVSGALLEGEVSRPGVTTNITARRYLLR